MSKIRRAAVTVTTGALVLTSACFGSFNLSRKLWTFNRDVSKDKFVREIVFLGMNIIPVYGAVGFIDAVLLNTVEFWSGSNPVSMSSRSRLDDGTVVQRVAYEKDGARVMAIKTFKDDTLVSTTTMNAVPGTDEVAFKTVLAGGRTVLRVVGTDAAGQPYLVSASDSNK
ncbi:MAG TPA: DUF3332 family protein [Gemmatimonadaceae bacterium]